MLSSAITATSVVMSITSRLAVQRRTTQRSQSRQAGVVAGTTLDVKTPIGGSDVGVGVGMKENNEKVSG